MTEFAFRCQEKKEKSTEEVNNIEKDLLENNKLAVEKENKEKEKESGEEKENESTGNSTLDFLNENSSDYDELVAEAIASNPYSKKLIEEKTKEAIDVIEHLYAKDKALTTKEGIVNYLKEHTALSVKKIEETLVEYFLSMNVSGESSDFTYTIDKAEQISVDAIEINFKADITFYKEATKEKVDSITRYHTVVIAPSKDDKDDFIIYRMNVK